MPTGNLFDFQKPEQKSSLAPSGMVLPPLSFPQSSMQDQQKRPCCPSAKRPILGSMSVFYEVRGGRVWGGFRRRDHFVNSCFLSGPAMAGGAVALCRPVINPLPLKGSILRILRLRPLKGGGFLIAGEFRAWMAKTPIAQLVNTHF